MEPITVMTSTLEQPKPVYFRQPPHSEDQIQKTTLLLASYAVNGHLSSVLAADRCVIDPFTLFEAAQHHIVTVIEFGDSGRGCAELYGYLAVLFFRFPSMFVNFDELSKMGALLMPGFGFRRCAEITQRMTTAIREHLLACKTQMETSMGTQSFIGWNSTENIAFRRLGMTAHLLELHRCMVADGKRI